MQSPLNNTEVPARGHTFRNFVLLLAWVTALAAVAIHRETILDWWKLQNYTAPVAIVELADQTTMTDYSRKLFYVNHPILADKAQFVEKCVSHHEGQEQTIVLGCYHSYQSGIYLLNVDDPRLNGVKQVTAAHEVLHGVYDRLSDEERQRVDKLLEDYYRSELNDERILRTIEAYKQSEPNDVTNEMHSIFGTEIANLPPQLEEYYARYLSKRSQVVAFAAQYQAVFTSRQDQLEDYEAQLKSLKTRIDSLEAGLKDQQAAIDAKQAELTAARDSDVQAYNANVPVFNAMIDNYNARVEEVKNLVRRFNEIVALHNTLAEEQGQLVDELNAKATPINN